MEKKKRKILMETDLESPLKSHLFRGRFVVGGTPVIKTIRLFQPHSDRGLRKIEPKVLVNKKGKYVHATIHPSNTI